MTTDTRTWFFADSRFYGGVAAGAVLIAAIGFNWVGNFGFDWMLGSTADKHAQQSVVDRLSAVCVGRAQQATDATALLEAMRKESSWKQDDFVAEQGWSTFAPNDKSDPTVATNCAKTLAEATT